MRRKLALWICPDLRSEIAALQSGNTKCVLENGRLMDELAIYRRPRDQPTSAFKVMADHFVEAGLKSRQS